MSNKGTDDFTLPGGENDFGLLRFGLVDFPSVTGCLQQRRGLGGTPVDADQQRPHVVEVRRLGTVAADNFLRVHRPVVVAALPTSDIGEPRICIDKRSLNLVSSLVIHSVAMDDVSHVKSGNAYFPDAL